MKTIRVEVPTPSLTITQVVLFGRHEYEFGENKTSKTRFYNLPAATK